MAVRFPSWSRRRWLISACATAGAWASDRRGKGEVFETEVERYADPSTEFQVYRLTDPSYTSILPATYNRIISRNSSTLLYSCDRSGTPQAFRMTLRTGES